ncbi:MAG TPA: peptidoglycan DD-metalloendopeptidase family protein [Candidatus Paceibacterota bacterium]
MLPKLLFRFKVRPDALHRWWGFVPVLSVSSALVFTVINTIANPARPSTIADYSAFGDPLLNQPLLNIQDSAFLNNTAPSDNSFLDSDSFVTPIIKEGSFQNTNTSPSNNIKFIGRGLLTYKIVEGDTLSTIAANNGISVNTILWANNLKRSATIRPGQEVVILPVSGILHEVRDGETPESISSLYAISLKDFTIYNKTRISAGDLVVVPDAKPILSSSSTEGRVDARNYLAFPVKEAVNFGLLHLNAVDISAPCGTPIYASAEGLVTAVGNPKNWNDGWGGYIRIEHPNGIETFYSHNSKNLVSVDDYVSRGDEIAKIGNTGKVHGPTGCHVHFGVFGAKHPFAK